MIWDRKWTMTQPRMRGWTSGVSVVSCKRAHFFTARMQGNEYHRGRGYISPLKNSFRWLAWGPPHFCGALHRQSWSEPPQFDSTYEPTSAKSWRFTNTFFYENEASTRALDSNSPERPVNTTTVGMPYSDAYVCVLIYCLSVLSPSSVIRASSFQWSPGLRTCRPKESSWTSPALEPRTYGSCPVQYKRHFTQGLERASNLGPSCTIHCTVYSGIQSLDHEHGSCLENRPTMGTDDIMTINGPRPSRPFVVNLV